MLEIVYIKRDIPNHLYILSIHQTNPPPLQPTPSNLLPPKSHQAKINTNHNCVAPNLPNPSPKMCHSPRPRCQSCNDRAPHHRCHCPSKTKTINAISQQQQQSATLPTYDSLFAQTASPAHGWAMHSAAPHHYGAGRSRGYGCRNGCWERIRMLMENFVQYVPLFLIGDWVC